ncbi:MAG: hypothetical protein IJ480_01030 [Clostridia bacterium]|nr:hypothetical protein [Clostridia bacterium]
MKNKKYSTLLLTLLLIVSVIPFNISANEIMPLWDNTRSVYITHGLVDGNACCSVDINALTGTSKIDNVDITLYRIIGSALVLVEEWEDLSTTGSIFNFYDEVENVPGGYTYRLTVTADVHRYGIIENLDLYSDINY